MEARCEAKVQSAIRVERKLNVPPSLLQVVGAFFQQDERCVSATIFSANSINLSRSGSDLAQVEENAKAVVRV